MSENKYYLLLTPSDEEEENSSSGATKKSKEIDPPPSSSSSSLLPSGEHRLQSSYCFWVSKQPSDKTSNHHQSFDQSLQRLGTFSTCEQFWKVYTNLIPPLDVNPPKDFHVFKEGIKPMWEDEANRYGGKWIVRLRKGLAWWCWENLLMAMVGEQFMVGEEICGAVLSVRYHEDIVSVWNRSSKDTAVTNRIKETFRRVLDLPPSTIIEYKPHKVSINNHSNFRNSSELFIR